MKRCESCRHFFYQYEVDTQIGIFGCEIKDELDSLIESGHATEDAGIDSDCPLHETEEMRMTH